MDVKPSSIYRFYMFLDYGEGLKINDSTKVFSCLFNVVGTLHISQTGAVFQIICDFSFLLFPSLGSFNQKKRGFFGERFVRRAFSVMTIMYGLRLL